MNWKKMYHLTLSLLFLKFLLGWVGYSSLSGFGFYWGSFQILPLVLLGIHLFYVVTLDQVITKGIQHRQRLKVLEYLNYGVVAMYIFGFLSRIFLYFYGNLTLSSTFDVSLFLFLLLGWIISGTLIYLLFRTFIFRKQRFGKFSDKKEGNINGGDPQETLLNHNFTTVEERLALCKVCTNRTFNMEQGMLCTLNNEKPNFSNFCIDYYNDEKEQKRQLELHPPKQKKGFFGSWKAALLMSILGFARAAIRGFEDPMGIIFLCLGIVWLLTALFDNNRK